MELNEQDDDYEENAYPPKKSESPNKKYNKKNIIGEYIKNPYINKINIDSKFIFDHFDNVKYFQSLKNKNHIKLNQEELSFLKMFYNQNHLKASQFEKQEDFLDIDKNIYEQIINYNKVFEKRLNLSLNNYKEYYLNHSPIETELKPLKDKYGKFITILDEGQKFYHIYFDNSNKEIKRNSLKQNEKVKKIKIIIDYPVVLFKYLFDYIE